MGEVKISRAEAVAILAAANPAAKPEAIQTYAAQWDSYAEADRNIAKQGAVVVHPRTGAPIDNPYLKVRSHALSELGKIRKLNTDELWRLYGAEA
jgi:phage terminase small subunit